MKTAKPRVNRAALKRLDALLEGRKRMPRLATLAQFIRAEMPDVTVTLEEGYCNTDRQSAGCRYITHVGKGRTGTRLKVHRDGKVIYDHNAAETYRSNDDVVRWIRNCFEGRERPF